jgi:hypothetical protein
MSDEKTPHTRLKLKIGDHEFEAEGPPEMVMGQLEIFKEMIATIPPHVAGAITPTPRATPTVPPPIPTAPSIVIDDMEALSKIMKIEERIVSLTVRARSIDDAVLLIVYGQKAFRDSDSVTGGEVMEGLTVSGLRVPRVDRLLEKSGETGDVIVIGERRSKRYRLTNTGLTKARAVAAELIALVP